MIRYGISALISQTLFRGETTRGVAKCRLFSQAISDFVTEMSDLFLAILKKVSLSYALTTLISFHEQNGLNCAWKDCEIASHSYQIHRCDRNDSKSGGGVAVCSSLPSGSLAGFTLHRENCEFRHAMGTRIVYTSPLRKCQKS